MATGVASLCAAGLLVVADAALVLLLGALVAGEGCTRLFEHVFVITSGVFKYIRSTLEMHRCVGVLHAWGVHTYKCF